MELAPKKRYKPTPCVQSRKLQKGKAVWYLQITIARTVQMQTFTFTAR